MARNSLVRFLSALDTTRLDPAVSAARLASRHPSFHSFGATRDACSRKPCARRSGSVSAA